MEEKAKSVSLAARDQTIQVVAACLSRRKELGEKARKLLNHRITGELFNDPENEATSEILFFRPRVHATMASFAPGDAAVCVVPDSISRKDRLHAPATVHSIHYTLDVVFVARPPQTAASSLSTREVAN